MNKSDMDTDIVVVQGEYHISHRPDVRLTTLLGSCVAACLYDETAKMGGMNHFLLPGDSTSRSNCLRYGANAMELLINSLLKGGAERSRLKAKLFGGSKMNSSANRIGETNIEFAKWFLQNEDIPIISQNLGGNRGRKLRFWPYSGRVQQMLMADSAPVLQQENLVVKKSVSARPLEEGVVLFL